MDKRIIIKKQDLQRLVEERKNLKEITEFFNTQNSTDVIKEKHISSLLKSCNLKIMRKKKDIPVVLEDDIIVDTIDGNNTSKMESFNNPLSKNNIITL